MATLPQFKTRQIARRSTSDVDRLATQFRRDIESLTGEYETAFSKFQKERAAQMAPFEAEMERYKSIAMPAYETAAAEYQKALDAYNAQLKELEANPTVRKTGTYEEKVPRWGLFGLAGYETRTSTYEYDEPRPIPKFEATKPAIPTAPTAPKLAEFESAPFESRKAALQQEYSREVGERRAGRLTAATRRSARPMLQGA